jgi:bacillithiol system protein YtxJ
MLHWINLTADTQLDDLIAQSAVTSIVIFKHSTRCNISVAAKGRLERNWDATLAGVPAYYLDLLNYRPLSQKIADVFAVHHESPQLLLIRNGECTYVESHLGISVDDLRTQL